MKDLDSLIKKSEYILSRKGYSIILDNSKANSHNVNIDYPTYFCFATSKEEAIGKMMLSNFAYKHKEIVRVEYF